MNLLLQTLLFYATLGNPATGSGPAYLTGTSASGRTTFTAELQDITGLLSNAELTIDGSTLTFNSNDEATTIFDPENGVLTVYLNNQTGDYKFLQFWAIPSTFKTLMNDRSTQIYEFNAKIRGTESRPNEGLLTPTIELTCKLEYRI